MATEPTPIHPDQEPELVGINWADYQLDRFEATLQAVTVELAQPLDRGDVVELRVRAVASFVGAGVDNRQKTTLKAVDAEVL